MKKNQKIVLLILFLVSHFFVSITVFASENTSQLAVQYVDIEGLNSKQITGMQQGKPQVTPIFDEESVWLVYRKNGENIQKTTSSTAPMESKVEQLPKTGENIGDKIIKIVGFVFLVTVGGLLVIKRSLWKELLLLVLVLSGLGLRSAEFFAASFPNIKPTVQRILEKNRAYTEEPAMIEGYTYVGYFPSSWENPVIAVSTVKISYQDKEGQDLHGPVVLSGKVGDSYDTNSEEFQLLIPGYELDQTRLPTNRQGFFTEEQGEITYIYQKDVQKIGQVEVVYLDEEGVELHETQLLTGNIGDEFDLTTANYRLSIEGYTLNQDRLPTNSSGHFSAQQQVVTYYYQKEHQEASLTIKFVDYQGNQLKLNDLATLKNNMVEFYPDIVNYSYLLDYNQQTYEQNTLMPDIVIQKQLGDTYTLPEKMTFDIQNSQKQLVEHLATPNEAGSTSGIINLRTYENNIPKNHSGVMTAKNVVVIYKIQEYGYFTPEP